MARWDFDTGVTLFGSFIEHELDSVQLTASERKSGYGVAELRQRRQARLHDLLGMEGAEGRRHIASLDDLDGVIPAAQARASGFFKGGDDGVS